MQLQQAQGLIPDKKSFYKACVRNGYFMPAFKSSLSCIKYMQRIRSKKYWCPAVFEIHPHTCVDPPKKEVVLEHLLGFARDANKNLGITNKRQPDKAWALAVLQHLKPDHKFFRKDYVTAKVKDKILIDNRDGFLDNLPPGPLKKKFGIVFKEAEEVQLQRQLLLYEKRLKKNKTRLRELEKKKDSDSEDDVEVSSDSEDDDQ